MSLSLDKVHAYVYQTPVASFAELLCQWNDIHTDKEGSKISTVVVRGSTDNIMDDVERAVDDAINTFKALTKDPRFVPGAGATEIELAKQLANYGEVSCGRYVS